MYFSSTNQHFNMIILLKLEYGCEATGIDNNNELNEREKKERKEQAIDDLKTTCSEFFCALESLARGVALSLYYKFQGETIERVTADLRHELGQSNSGILANIDEFDKSIKIYRPTSEVSKKIQNVVKNMRAFANVAMVRTNITRYMSGMPEPEIQPFRPYGTFLYKWSEIYYSNMDDRKLKFVIIPLNKDDEGNYIEDENRPEMYADEDMIEQILYNLTNNAQKYSVPGTVVTLDCRLSECMKWYQIIISNYAFSMKDENEYKEIFKRGFQGSNATGIATISRRHNKNSGGIGLAISKEIAVKHGGKLELSSKTVSRFCVPYFIEYDKLKNDERFMSKINAYKSDKEYQYPPNLENLIEAEKKELKKNKKLWFDLNAIPLQNTKDFIITGNTVVDSICRGISKYTFTLSIPHDKE
jgi:signal transduction histidine kinase